MNLLSFLEYWTGEIYYCENNPQDDSVTFSVKAIGGRDVTITLQKGETLYATDTRLL